MVRCVLEVDLICPDAKTAHDNEIPSLRKYPSCKLRLGADTNYMHVSRGIKRSAEDSTPSLTVKLGHKGSFKSNELDLFDQLVFW
jgi:hypothetical protein